MRRWKDANKTRLWAITISSSFMVLVPQSCVLFSCGADVASSKNTPNRRSGCSLRRCFSAANNSRLKFTSQHSQPKLSKSAWPGCLASLINHNCHRRQPPLQSGFPARGRDWRIFWLFPMTIPIPSVTQMSHIYQQKWLLKTQRDSCQMSYMKVRVWMHHVEDCAGTKMKAIKHFFPPLQSISRGEMKGKRYRQQSGVITATGAGVSRCRPTAERMCCNNKY